MARVTHLIKSAKDVKSAEGAESGEGVGDAHSVKSAEGIGESVRDQGCRTGQDAQSVESAEGIGDFESTEDVESAEDVLQAPMVLEYPFTRTTGPVIGAFLTGLRERVILGIRRADGSVLCPPLEYDPITSEPLTELVEVTSVGEVVTWAWNGDPRPQQPFDRPFAWALIRLDGADTPMLHAVLVDTPDEMATGMRVRALWRDDRSGHIADIAGFEAVSV